MRTQYSPAAHQRRSIRLKDYDYSQAGAYYVTICTHQRACLFGAIVADAMRLNACGDIVQACWNAIPQHFSDVELDAFVVMPNHVHGVIIITHHGREEAFAARPARVQRRASVNASPLRAGTQPQSLGAIVQNFKSLASRKINQLRRTPSLPIWQRIYYEHIIRDERELHRVRQYIADNPLQWALDKENPANM